MDDFDDVADEIDGGLEPLERYTAEMHRVAEAIRAVNTLMAEYGYAYAGQNVETGEALKAPEAHPVLDAPWAALNEAIRAADDAGESAMLAGDGTSIYIMGVVGRFKF